MALAYTNTAELDSDTNPQGKVTRVVGATATFDASYPTGGEDIVAADISTTAAGAMTAVDFVVIASTSGSEVVSWDRANETLLVFTADGTQAGNASDQSGVSVELLIYGS